MPLDDAFALAEELTDLIQLENTAGRPPKHD